MSQLNTPFTYWNANPFTDLKIINVLCTKKFDKIIISFENGIIWIFKIFNKTDGKKEFIPTLCLLGHETTVSALTLVKLNIELLNESDNAIVSTSKDGTIIMWDLNDGHCILKKKHFFNGIIKTIKVSKSMKYLICSGYSCDIYILTLDTLEIKQIININNDWISTMTLKNATSEIFLAYESGEMSIFKFDEESLNLINEETKTNIHTIPNAFEICINEYNPNIFFVLSKEICLIYSRQLNIELPILKVNSPDGLYWKKGQFLSPRTFILWTMNSNIYIYYIGHKSDLKIFNDNQISELDDSYEILLSNSEYHITIKKSILEHELLETNNPVTIIGTLNLGKSSVNAWDEADIQCIKGNNSEFHILSFQNIENKAFLYYWSFYSCINPINYITYYKKSENESNSNVNINSDSEKIDFSNETVIQIKPIHEILLEDLWNIKSENYPRKSLVTAVTSFSSLFIIFGYESGLIKVMPLYYPFLYDINTFSDSENEVYSLNGHSRRVTSLYVPKKIDSNGKLLLFSSSIDASVIIWDLESGKQLLKYNEYTRPVVQFVQVSKEKEGNLFHDCVVAFSEDNSISVFSLEKLECIYHLSGHYSELAQISWRKDSDYLCVQCVDKSVYVWHLKSMHLDRIITDPYYAEIIIGNCDAKIKFNPFNTDYSKLNNKQILSVFPVYFKPYGQIPVFVFYINIKQLINEINYFHRMSGASFSNSSSKKKNGRSSPENGINNKSIMNPNNKSSKQIGLSLMLKSSHFKGVGNPNGKSLSHLYRRFTQLLFSSLLTWEIDAELDNICKKKIGLNPNRKNITVGIKGVDNQFSLLAPFSSEDQIWKISPLYTASRLIKILSFVPIFLSEKGNEDDVISIITHYGIMLPGIVGPDYNYPSFSHLTKYWQDSTNDIQQAARCLYRSTLSKISESDLDKVLNYWEPYLVIDDPNNLTKVTLRAAILLGIIGADENDLLKSKHTLCNHISKALLLIIENKTSLQHRIAAVELIGKGFLVWEPYINGSAVIRILMNLANLNPNSPSSTNNSPTNSISSSKSSINTGNNINNNNNNTNNNNNNSNNNNNINNTINNNNSNNNNNNNNNINNNTNSNSNNSQANNLSLKSQLNRQLTQKFSSNSSSNIALNSSISNNPNNNKNNLLIDNKRNSKINNDIHANSTTMDNSNQPTSSRSRTLSSHTGTSAMTIMARQALIQIATHNTPLFITTLTFDLVHSKKIYERQAGLQLLSLFINKKPLIIYPYLSKIVEAVVKSLDPNVPNMRENMIQSVTLSLHDLVKKYPNIAFHGHSQRIAIGSIDGLILIYDLKTGTRWQILEGHQKPISAVSFSPDGKLIASYSLEEACVRVWQPSPSFLGMLVGTFNSSESNNTPMKSIRSYSVGKEIKGGENSISLNAIIENVRFEWTSENKVKLIGLRGSAMNVSV